MINFFRCYLDAKSDLSPNFLEGWSFYNEFKPSSDIRNGFSEFLFEKESESVHQKRNKCNIGYGQLAANNITVVFQMIVKNFQAGSGIVPGSFALVLAELDPSLDR